MGFFWGVDQDETLDLLKKLFFDKVRTQKPGKSSLSDLCFGPKSQSIGRGRISREGALDHRESRERRDKIFAAKTVKRHVAYQNPRLIRPFPQCHLPKLKHISAEALP